MKTETKENKCVHTEHCCILHGCKYGDEYCPVESGNKRQSFLCESCNYMWENTPEENKELEEQIYAKFSGTKKEKDGKVIWNKDLSSRGDG